MTDDELEELRHALRNRIKDLAEALLGPPSKLSTRFDWRWGTRGSFSVWVGGPKQGGWRVFGSVEKGDPLALIMHVRRCDFPQALEWADAWVGGTAYHVPEPSKPAAQPSGDTTRYAGRLVEESTSCGGTLGEQYLRQHRGLTGLLPAELRFHPAVWSRETKSTHPGLLFVARDGKGLVRRIQAVLLDPETASKANVPSAKITYGRNASHIPVIFAARIPGQCTTLTTGPEDAIAIWSAQGHRTMASLGDGTLAKPRFVAGSDLTLFGDNDQGGELATRRGVGA